MTKMIVIKIENRFPFFAELHERIRTLEQLFKYRSIVAQTMNHVESARDIQNVYRRILHRYILLLTNEILPNEFIKTLGLFKKMIIIFAIVAPRK